MENRSSALNGCILITLVIVAVVAFVALIWAAEPVKFGTVEAVTEFGRLTGRQLQPGWNWIMPFTQRTEKVRTVVLSYETSNNPDTSEADYTDYPVDSQTNDGQRIYVTYSVKFRVTDPAYVLQNYGNLQEVVENIVKVNSRSLSRQITKQFSAEELYSGTSVFQYMNIVSREGVTVDGIHYDSLEESFAKSGLALVEFLVRDFDFDQPYKDAVTQKQIEAENIITAKNQAEKAKHAANEAENRAEGEKRARIQHAQGEAEAVRLAADAEAYAIQIRGEELSKYPEITQWEFVKQMYGVNWGILPADTVTPFLPISPETGVTE